jgi:hypothetical protein
VTWESSTTKVFLKISFDERSGILWYDPYRLNHRVPIEVVPQCEHFVIDSIQPSFEQQMQADTGIGIDKQSGDLFVGHRRGRLTIAAGGSYNGCPGIKLILFRFS